MLKTVWLNDLIIKLLNDATSKLAQSLNSVFSNLDAKECIMCLFEPDFDNETYYLISKKASLIISKEEAKINKELVDKSIDNKQIINENHICVAPLYFNNVSVFGYLMFEGELKQENEEYLNCQNGMPFVGQTVNTKYGSGKVVSVDILNRKYKVDIDNDVKEIELGPCGKSSK